MKVLVLLWHPPFHGALAAGGFVRTKAVLERFPIETEFHVIDSYAPFFSFQGALFDIYRPWRIVSRFRVFNAFGTFCEIISAFWFLLIRSMRVLRRRDIDVVYVPSSEILWITVVACALKKMFHVRTIACNQNVEGKNGFIRFIQWCNIRFHNRCYDGVITVSRALRKALVKQGLHVPINVHLNGIDHVACKGLRQEQKRYDAIFVGRHEAEKGIFDTIEIWKRVVREYPSARFALVGYSKSSVMEDLRARVRRAGLLSNILFCGQVSESEKYRLLASSKVFLFPSRCEGWGLAPQEALMCGLPVVAYQLEAYKESIASCPAVFLVDLGDVEAMAQRVCALLRDDAYQKHREVGPLFVKRYSWVETAINEYRVLSGTKDNKVHSQ